MTGYDEALENYWGRLFDSLKIILDALKIYKEVNESYPIDTEELNLFNPVIDEDGFEFHIKESEKNLLKIYFINIFTYLEVYLIKIRNQICEDSNSIKVSEEAKYTDWNTTVLTHLEKELEISNNDGYLELKSKFQKLYEVRKGLVHRRGKLKPGKFIKNKFLKINSENIIISLDYEYLQECKAELQKFVKYIDEIAYKKFREKFDEI